MGVGDWTFWREGFPVSVVVGTDITFNKQKKLNVQVKGVIILDGNGNVWLRFC